MRAVSMISGTLLTSLFGALVTLPVQANPIDTLTGLTPGDLIGGQYTFQNGNPPIPMASDHVTGDGTVSFVKPNAPYDNIEYVDLTTGQPILAFITPLNTPVNTQLFPNTSYPIVAPTIDSFFDVFFEISLEPFNVAGDNAPGTFVLGQQFTCANGTCDGLPGVTIGDYTGQAVVRGFDEVSATPLPPSWALMAAGCVALGCFAYRGAKNKAATLVAT